MCSGPLNKNNYLQIVRAVLGRHAADFSTEKLDLVFRTLDSNRDGFLDQKELERVSQEILNHGCASQSHCPPHPMSCLVAHLLYGAAAT